MSALLLGWLRVQGMPNVYAFFPKCRIGKHESEETEERVNLFCSPGAKPDRDSGEARPLGRVNVEPTSATNEHEDGKATSKTSHNAEIKSHHRGAAATRQHHRSKRVKKVASKHGRRSHESLRASSADEYDDNLYESETKDGARGPCPANGTVKS